MVLDVLKHDDKKYLLSNKWQKKRWLVEIGSSMSYLWVLNTRIARPPVTKALKVAKSFLISIVIPRWL